MAERYLLITDRAAREKLAKAFSDPNIRQILSAPLPEAKSVRELSTLLGVSTRTLYRYIDENGNGSAAKSFLETFLGSFAVWSV